MVYWTLDAFIIQLQTLQQAGLGSAKIISRDSHNGQPDTVSGAYKHTADEEDADICGVNKGDVCIEIVIG